MRKFAKRFAHILLGVFCEEHEIITLDYQAFLRCKSSSFSQIPQLFRQENDICERFSSAPFLLYYVKAFIIKRKLQSSIFANDSIPNKSKITANLATYTTTTVVGSLGRCRGM